MNFWDKARLAPAALVAIAVARFPFDDGNTVHIFRQYRIEDKGLYFEAEIRTKDGSLVDKLLVDKETGRMRSVY